MGSLCYIVINKVLFFYNKDFSFWIIIKHNNRVIDTVWTLEKKPTKASRDIYFSNQKSSKILISPWLRGDEYC